MNAVTKARQYEEWDSVNTFSAADGDVLSAKDVLSTSSCWGATESAAVFLSIQSLAVSKSTLVPDYSLPSNPGLLARKRFGHRNDRKAQKDQRQQLAKIGSEADAGQDVALAASFKGLSHQALDES